MAVNSYLRTDCAALSAARSYLSACGHLSKDLRLPKEIGWPDRSGLKAHWAHGLATYVPSQVTKWSLGDSNP
jgi:hypothetical protein